MSGNALTKTNPTCRAYGPAERSHLDLMGIRFLMPEGDGSGGAGGGGGGGGGNDADKPVTFANQAELDRIIADRVTRAKEPFKDFESLKQKADKFDALEKDNLTDSEKVTEKLTALENRATTAEAAVEPLKLALLRYEVAADKKLDLSHAARLIGATKEELEKDADAFIASIGGTNAGGSKKDLGQGGRDEETPGSKGKSEAARRFGTGDSKKQK